MKEDLNIFRGRGETNGNVKGQEVKGIDSIHKYTGVWHQDNALSCESPSKALYLKSSFMNHYSPVCEMSTTPGAGILSFTGWNPITAGILSFTGWLLITAAGRVKWDDIWTSVFSLHLFLKTPYISKMLKPKWLYLGVAPPIYPISLSPLTVLLLI